MTAVPDVDLAVVPFFQAHDGSVLDFVARATVGTGHQRAELARGP